MRRAGGKRVELCTPRSQSHRVSPAPSLGQAQEPGGKVPFYPELPSSVRSSLPPSTLIPSSLAENQSSYLPLLSHRSYSPVLGTHYEFPCASVLLVWSFPSALHYLIPATPPHPARLYLTCTSPVVSPPPRSPPSLQAQDSVHLVKEQTGQKLPSSATNPET